MFDFTTGETGAPLLSASPLTMECRVVDVYETESFESFVAEIVHTFADESVLGENGKIDYRALKPILFEMPTYEYHCGCFFYNLCFLLLHCRVLPHYRRII